MERGGEDAGVPAAGVAVVGGAAARFWHAFRFPMRGARLVFVEHRDLARIWIWPVLLTGAAMAAGTWAAWAWNEALVERIWPAAGGEASWFTSGLRWAGEVLVGLVLTAAAVVFAVVLASPIASPFNDALSRALEDRLGGAPEHPVSILRDVTRSVLLELLKLALLAAALGPLLVLSWLVPFVGPALYTVAAGALTALYFALDYTEWPWVRRGLGLRARLGELARDWPSSLGFGAGVWLVMFLPVVNLALMPMAVAGGTLWVREVDARRSRRAGPSPAPGPR